MPGELTARHARTRLRRTPEDEGRDPEEVEKEKRRKEAKSRAVVLEMIGACEGEGPLLERTAPRSLRCELARWGAAPAASASRRRPVALTP